MDYTGTYNRIVDKARREFRSKKNGIYELHHIIPKSLGGSDRMYNRVLLTSKELFVCHLLLTRMHEGDARKKMCWALHRLMGLGRMTAGEYALARKIHANNMSSPKSETTKEKMRKPKSAQHAINIGKGLSAYWKGKVRTRSKENMENWHKAMKAKKDAGWKPKPLTEEQRERAVKNRTYGPLSEEHKRKLSEAHKGRVHSESSIQKMREAKKAFWQRKREMKEATS